MNKRIFYFAGFFTTLIILLNIMPPESLDLNLNSILLDSADTGGRIGLYQQNLETQLTVETLQIGEITATPESQSAVETGVQAQSFTEPLNPDQIYSIDSDVKILRSQLQPPIDPLLEFDGLSKILHKDNILIYKIIFSNISASQQEAVILQASIPEGSQLIADSISLDSKTKDRIRVKPRKFTLNIDSNIISTRLDSFEPKENIILIYQVINNKTYGNLIQGSSISKENQLAFESNKLLNIALPAEFESLPKRYCLSKQTLVNLLDELLQSNATPEKEYFLKNLIPLLNESVSYFLNHKTESAVYQALKNAFLTIPCVLMPQNFMAPVLLIENAATPEAAQILEPGTQETTQETMETTENTQETTQETTETTQETSESTQAVTESAETTQQTVPQTQDTAETLKAMPEAVAPVDVPPQTIESQLPT